MTLRLRFLAWRLRHLFVVSLIALAAYPALNPTPHAHPARHDFPTAATDLPLGAALSETDLVESSPTNTAPETATGLIGQVLLVPVNAGEPITDSMTAPSLSSGFGVEGEILTSAQIGNPEVLAYAAPGRHLDLYAHLEQDAKRVVHRGVVVALPHANTAEDRSNTPWQASGSNTTFVGSSSTVLLAVTEREAALLATIPTWDSSLMAVLVD